MCYIADIISIFVSFFLLFFLCVLDYFSIAPLLFTVCPCKQYTGYVFFCYGSRFYTHYKLREITITHNYYPFSYMFLSRALAPLICNCKDTHYWVSQNLPQICTASAYVYHKSILKQMQYTFTVNFGTLSI